ncbi:MAG: O-antigen ligase family protein [Bacteroidota bacterium]|nr:O-antigen ligase family protein [Bacteroidota bacterium]
MSEQRIITHKYIMVAALCVSVAALPFSVKICHGAIIILLLNWAAEGDWRAKQAVVRHSLLLQVFIGFFLIQLAGLFLSDSIFHGWFSLEKKIFLLMLPLALATSSVRLTRRDVQRVMWVFVAACLAGTFLCILHSWQETSHLASQAVRVDNYLGTTPYFELHKDASEKWLIVSYASLASGIGIHPTYFSLYLAFCISFLLAVFPAVTSRLQRAGMLTLVLYLTLLVVFLSSRIMIAGLSVIYLVVLLKTFQNKARVWSAAAMGLIFFFAAVLYANPVTRYRNLEEVRASTFDIQPAGHYANAAQIRVSLWWLALSCLPDLNPLFGSGTGDVEKVMSRASEKYRITNSIQSLDPHNQYLYSLLANGVPGLAVLMLALFVPAYCAWAQKDLLLISFLFLFSILCLTESAFELQKGIVFYAIISGMLFFHVHSFQVGSPDLRSLLRAGQ